MMPEGEPIKKGSPESFVDWFRIMIEPPNSIVEDYYNFLNFDIGEQLSVV